MTDDDAKELIRSWFKPPNGWPESSFFNGANQTCQPVARQGLTKDELRDFAEQIKNEPPRFTGYVYNPHTLRRHLQDAAREDSPAWSTEAKRSTS